MPNALTPTDTQTVHDLQHLIDVAKPAVVELMSQFDCTVEPSVEALALLKQVKGEAFGDELFILLRAAQRVPSVRYANLTGPGIGIERPGTPAHRSKVGDVLDKVAATVLAAEQVINGGRAAVNPPTGPPSGGDGGDGNDGPSDDNKRILGLSPAIFYGGCVVMLLVIVVLLIRKAK